MASPLFVLPFALTLTLILASPVCMGRPFPAGETLIGSQNFDSIFNFGDSISDTGNLLRQGAAIIGRLPYGETLGTPTGRCSDGRLIIDYLAQSVNLPYVPPYLDVSANFDHGVNFAVAGATALDRSFFVERGINATFTNSSLAVQLQWFKTHLNSRCTSKQDCKRILAKALFLVGEIGGNDYNYGLMAGQKSIDEIKGFVPHVVGSIVGTVQELIDLGAVHLVVPGNFPIGCFPCYLSLPNKPASNSDGCIGELNEFAAYHNDRLQAALNNLKKDHPDVTIKYADYYHAFLSLLDKADGYGFDGDSLFKACCGAGGANNYDPNHSCGKPGATVCPDPSKFISWDGVHLTQAAYNGMTTLLVSTGLLLH